MALLNFRKVSLSYGAAPLLDEVSFAVDEGERVCLVGRNGAGKSTMMKLIDGAIHADDGEVVHEDGVRIARLEQEVPKGAAGSVFDVVAEGLGEAGHEVSRYHHWVQTVALDPSEQNLKELERCQQRLEALGGWEMSQRVETVLSRLELDGEKRIEELSGGLKRRVLLARALVIEPHLLLLDEPTNHLDIDAIRWLEEYLAAWQGALIFITHDRSFLRRLATRIIELDRGRLTDWPGDYDNYLRRKQEQLAAEEKENALFDKRLAAEEVWIRQGIKARRTRNEGRVRALKEMRRERADRRERVGQAKMSIQDAGKSGKIVVEAENISFAYDGKPLVKDFSITMMRGDKVGIIGPNGVGKTTLLRLLLGELEPREGKIRVGTNLEVAYFDQYRATLNEERTVQENLGDGTDQIMINGKPRHVISYLQDFLFAPERIRQPVSALSGGERNRLLLARLFTRPSNVLVLDEPTNDLDSDTLDLLEELLMDYPGTVLLVSHDRAFLDNVVTSTLVFEQPGVVNEYVGGYEDWLRQRPAAAEGFGKTQGFGKKKAARDAKKSTPVIEPAGKPKKLSYKDQRELETLPKTIERLEQEQAELVAAMNDPEFFRQEKDVIARHNERLAEIGGELEVAYCRWEDLEL